MNLDEIDWSICRSCAKCCKAWWMFTDLKDDALRASWLDTDKVTVQRVSNDDLWKIMFHIPCKQLISDDGKYTCKQHKGHRPGYCREYPLNFLDGKEYAVLENEKRFCPLLRRLA